MTDIEIVPDGLTEVIRCKYFAKTTICTGRKYGLACVSVAGGCRGTECNNIEVCFLRLCIPIQGCLYKILKLSY